MTSLKPMSVEEARQLLEHVDYGVPSFSVSEAEEKIQNQRRLLNEKTTERSRPWRLLRLLRRSSANLEQPTP